MSKKKLKQRLYDICHGAGLLWLEEDQYFDDFCMENLRDAINSIVAIFNLKPNNRLYNPNYWPELENLDEMTDLVQAIIENEGE
jgi:hypothetical protein